LLFCFIDDDLSVNDIPLSVGRRLQEDIYIDVHVNFNAIKYMGRNYKLQNIKDGQVVQISSSSK